MAGQARSDLESVRCLTVGYPQLWVWLGMERVGSTNQAFKTYDLRLKHGHLSRSSHPKILDAIKHLQDSSSILGNTARVF
jgi:hypothetical protein